MKSLRALLLLAILPLMSFGKFSPTMPAIHEGDGNITVETRRLGEFHAVNLRGAYEVTIVQGAQSDVRIETDQNLHQNITTTIKNGELIISSEDIQPTKGVYITITSPNYNAVGIEGVSHVKAATPITSDDLSLDVEGAGSFSMEVHAPHLKSEIGGSGKMELTGDSHNYSAGINGSGNIAANKLTADITKVEINGSGYASLNVADRLVASISGSGSVRYRGAVKDVHQTIIGSGSVSRAND